MPLPDPPHAEKSNRYSRRLALAVQVHFAAMVAFTSWAFGGQIPWARDVIAVLGGVGLVLFLAACQQARRGRLLAHPALRLLWPLWLYDVLVIASCFNPAFRETVVGGERILILRDTLPWLPTGARPTLAIKELWQFNGIVLSAFNLLLALNRRSQIRALLFFFAGNAMALAIFGTLQKLSGASGLWFGLVPSPQKYFFSTFVYHNHWGAFILLNTAVCLALCFHFLREHRGRDLWHSPVPTGSVATLLLAAAVPLSASRSATGLMIVLLLFAGVHLIRLITRRRSGSAGPAIAGIVAAATLAVATIGYLGRDVIAQRLQLTSEQLAYLAREDSLNAREILYRDTWRMAMERPWFGWGLESYAHTFRIFNTQRAIESVFWIPFYAEAHSDWLQSLAEVGFVGTVLLVTLGILPLWRHRRRLGATPVPRYLLTGAGLLLLYAWLEFPFANPAVMMMFCGLWFLAARHLQLDEVHGHD